MIFKYVGIDKSGKKIKQKIEALNLKEAKQKVKSDGIIIQEIKEDKASIAQSFKFFNRYKISSKELSFLSRELSMYIRSGITIVSAVKIVKTHYETNKKMKLFLTTISTHLDEGKDFYTALNIQNVVKLPSFFIESIKVSENGGILDEVLLELSRFLKEQEDINKEIKKAFVYPSFMIAISFIMISFMLVYVVPEITAIFSNLDQELPLPTIMVIAAGDFFSSNFITMSIVSIIFIFVFLLLMKKSFSFAYFIDKTLLKIPFFGKIIEKKELARFSYITSLLLRSGVPFVKTINLSTNTLDNLVLKKLFEGASKKVVEGKLFSNALNNSIIKIDDTFIQTVALGEETSQLKRVFFNISELYFEENRDKISVFITLLEPILMLVVGGTIGFIVAAMLLPIFSMSIT